MKTIFLMVSLLLFTACAQMPLEHLYTVDTQHGVCAKRKIINKKTMEVSTETEELALDACDGFIAIDYHEYLEFKRWLQKVQKRAKDSTDRMMTEDLTDQSVDDVEEVRMSLP